ncbi:GLPGLI family protein [Croceimicrobium hydrocarbonivorans]|uniref:GLPGLI family protein n=1 Tax=Croceimicrobium hydrocarbonivorans TaxID=2761580 RepID=A0A7H0VFN0_9FLAO|nr:GLPGLI family protein [Croceimicrobium hydrocarbonivorans]QNR24528.1 GLPGLI family protein [Croceimicrobium hydrocarbonivorans]
MKLSLTTILLYLTLFSAPSSNPQIQSQSFKIKYDWFCSFCAGKGFSSILYSNDLGSFYVFKEKDLHHSARQDETIIHDTTRRYIRFDRTRDSIYELGFLRSINASGIIIAEKQSPIKWNLIDSNRVIEGYECKYAVGNFRGRKYYAWYDPSVKTNYGPWKLHGLPGAIIFVIDSTEELSFKAINIEPTKIQSFDQILKLRKLPIVARSVYREKREEVYNRMGSIKPEEGSGVTFDISIEKNYFEFE